MTVCFNSKNKIYIVMRKYENDNQTTTNSRDTKITAPEGARYLGD